MMKYYFGNMWINPNKHGTNKARAVTMSTLRGYRDLQLKMQYKNSVLAGKAEMKSKAF